MIDLVTIIRCIIRRAIAFVEEFSLRISVWIVGVTYHWIVHQSTDTLGQGLGSLANNIRYLLWYEGGHTPRHETRPPRHHGQVHVSALQIQKYTFFLLLVAWCRTWTTTML